MAARLTTRLLLGAIAGVVGTVAMTAAMNRLHPRLPRSDRYPLPPREITERLVGTESEDDIKDAATAAHHGYGAAAGALLAAARPALIARFGRMRSEERRVGKGWVRTCRSRGWPYN